MTIMDACIQNVIRRIVVYIIRLILFLTFFFAVALLRSVWYCTGYWFFKTIHINVEKKNIYILLKINRKIIQNKKKKNTKKNHHSTIQWCAVFFYLLCGWICELAFECKTDTGLYRKHIKSTVYYTTLYCIIKWWL